MKKKTIVELYMSIVAQNAFGAEAYIIENSSSSFAELEVVKGTMHYCDDNPYLTSFYLDVDEKSRAIECGEDTALCFRYRKDGMDEWSDWYDNSCGLTSGTETRSFN